MDESRRLLLHAEDAHVLQDLHGHSANLRLEHERSCLAALTFLVIESRQRARVSESLVAGERPAVGCTFWMKYSPSSGALLLLFRRWSRAGVEEDIWLRMA